MDSKPHLSQVLSASSHRKPSVLDTVKLDEDLRRNTESSVLKVRTNPDFLLGSLVGSQDNTPPINTYIQSVKRNDTQRRAKVNQISPWCVHSMSGGLPKGITPDKATSSSKRFKSVSLAIIELCLSEGISQSDSQSVSQSEKSVKYIFFKVCSDCLKVFRGNLWGLLALVLLNQYSLIVV